MSKEENANTGTSGAGHRMAYHKPELKLYGDVRTLTLAVTAGVFENEFERSRRSSDTDSRGGRSGG